MSLNTEHNEDGDEGQRKGASSTRRRGQLGGGIKALQEEEEEAVISWTEFQLSLRPSGCQQQVDFVSLGLSARSDPGSRWSN